MKYVVTKLIIAYNQSLQNAFLNCLFTSPAFERNIMDYFDGSSTKKCMAGGGGEGEETVNVPSPVRGHV